MSNVRSTTSMRRIALTAIRLYQRYVSPHKGFSCAYRRHTGRAGCSAFGYRAVRRYGVIRGALLVRSRTRLCGAVHRDLVERRPERRMNAQRGLCDLACDVPGCDLPNAANCDLPSGKSLSGALDFLSCCDCCSCDWPSRKRRPEERSVRRRASKRLAPEPARPRTRASDTPTPADAV